VDALLLAARLVLAAVFAAAAAAKLADRPGTRATAVELGVPEAFAGAVSLLLPAAELAVAAVLLPAATAVAGAVAGLALLAVLSATVGLALAHGRAFDCACFGQLHSEPVGWSTLVRNAVLAGLAGFVAVGGWDDPGPSALVGLVPLGLGCVLLVLALSPRSRNEIRLPAPRAPVVGAHPFELDDIEGVRTSLDDLLRLGRPVLLVFADELASDLLQRLVELQRYESYAVTVVLVTTEPDSAPPELDRVLVESAGEIRRAYDVGSLPAAVLVSSYGTLAGGPASGVAEIGVLAERALVEEEAPPPQWIDGLPLGAPMPRLALPDLRGRPVELDRLVDAETVFLFWRPGCKPCRGLYEHVVAWERARREAPRLVVVSLGGKRDSRSLRFRSTVLLDEELEASEAFQAETAPMAVRVDASRRISSPVAVGPEAVLSLLQA
jgi:Methylamine utilisation protein MauE